jgi:drug/metabolite transporter (DMT)-like permease
MMALRVILGGLLFSLLWSSAFATGRVIVAHASPLWALALRFAISGGLAVGLARAMGQGWPRDRAQLRSIVIFGLCQNALYLGLFFVAMQTIEASLAAILASSMPLAVPLLGWALQGRRLPLGGVLGLFAGFAGVVLILGSRLQGGADLTGILLCLGGVLALSVATLSAQGAAAGGNLMMIVGLQMLVGSAALTLVAPLAETPWATPGWPLAASFVWQVLGPGLAATLLWFWLIGRVGPVKAAAFHFLNPVFGLIIAALMLGERIGPMDLLGVALAGGGIFAVQRARLGAG